MQLTILLALLPLLAAPFTSARVLPRAGTNLQTFTGALGAAPTPIIDSGDAARPFSVKGNTFVNFGAAAQRSCDVQFNACANAANSGQAGLTVSACQTQQQACVAATAGTNPTFSSSGTATNTKANTGTSTDGACPA